MGGPSVHTKSSRNGASRKRSSNRKNLTTPALRLSLEWKHSENGVFRKRWYHDSRWVGACVFSVAWLRTRGTSRRFSCLSSGVILSSAKILLMAASFNMIFIASRLWPNSLNFADALDRCCEQEYDVRLRIATISSRAHKVSGIKSVLWKCCNNFVITRVVI